jgi:putative addiction module component (TIGR02574 family)
MIESSEIERMSVTERLQTMEQLWDSLCRDAALPSPEWHRDVLADRRARAQSGEAKFLTLDQLKSRLRGPQP